MICSVKSSLAIAFLLFSANSQKNTVRSYSAILSKFCDEFGDDNPEELAPDHILDFLSRKTEGCKQQTKRIRFSHLSAFFNFIKTNIDNDFQNPCDTPLLRKMFKAKPISSWEIIEKDPIDDVGNEHCLREIILGGLTKSWVMLTSGSLIVVLCILFTSASFFFHDFYNSFVQARP